MIIDMKGILDLLDLGQDSLQETPVYIIAKLVEDAIKNLYYWALTNN